MSEFFTDVPQPVPSRVSSPPPRRSPTACTTPNGWCVARRWPTTCASPCATGTASTGPAATCSAPARSIGPGCEPASTRWPRRSPSWTPPSSSSPSSARRSSASTTSTSRRRAPRCKETRPTSTSSSTRPRRRWTRPACGCCGAPPNLFSHPRYAAGAATNPDPEVFAHAAAQVRDALEATHRLGGANYVLWGGREGYETLLNTDMRREADQLARFLHLVAEHKHTIGFTGTLLIEPKPHEPTKHQYDYDCATVHGFLDRYDLAGEYQGQHRGQPRHAGRPQLPPRGGVRGRATASSAASTPTAATRRTAGTPTSSRTRSTS